MSLYQDGYDQGYADGRAGNSRQHTSSFLDILNAESQDEWEGVYDAGYADGEKEREE